MKEGGIRMVETKKGEREGKKRRKNGGGIRMVESKRGERERKNEGNMKEE